MTTCPHPNCSRHVKPGQLACRDHWFQLPPLLRAAINKTWRERSRDAGAAHSENVLEARRIWAEQVKEEAR